MYTSREVASVLDVAPLWDVAPLEDLATLLGRNVAPQPEHLEAAEAAAEDTTALWRLHLQIHSQERGFYVDIADIACIQRFLWKCCNLKILP